METHEISQLKNACENSVLQNILFHFKPISARSEEKASLMEKMNQLSQNMTLKRAEIDDLSAQLSRDQCYKTHFCCT